MDFSPESEAPAARKQLLVDAERVALVSRFSASW
jgi:hypothetical protein